jgi:hypothetical protein
MAHIFTYLSESVASQLWVLATLTMKHLEARQVLHLLNLLHLPSPQQAQDLTLADG